MVFKEAGMKYIFYFSTKYSTHEFFYHFKDKSGPHRGQIPYERSPLVRMWRRFDEKYPFRTTQFHKEVIFYCFHGYNVMCSVIQRNLI